MATNNAANNATAATGTVLQGAGVGTASVYSTATYPLTTTANQVLYSSATNTVSGLATAANGVLVTDGSSVPSIGTTLPTAVQGNITSTGNLGNQLNTTRSAFLAFPSANQTGVAKGAFVTVILATEIFDQNNNFASNTFTAPVTGKYCFQCEVEISAINAATRFEVIIVTTARTYNIFRINPTVTVPSGSGINGFNGCVFANMTANDTAILQVVVDGGTSTYTINTSSYFSGFLVC